MMALAGLLLVASTTLSPAANCDRAGVADTAISAALGDMRGMYDLGVEFYTGRCVDMSHKNAALMWEKAAAMGSIAAKHNLGFLLYKGLGVPKDEARAVALWEEAADAGHCEAQLHLGAALFAGRGVQEDRLLGMAWVLRAIESAKTADDAPDAGGGQGVLEMAQDELAAMEAEAPELLAQAKARSQALPGRR